MGRYALLHHVEGIDGSSGQRLMFACEGMVIDCAGRHPEQMRLVMYTDKDAPVITPLSLRPQHCSEFHAVVQLTYQAIDVCAKEDYHWEEEL